MDSWNIFLVGVGGQGVLVASEVLALGFLRAGYDVKKSEVHGMAQRGGGVSSHVRCGPSVQSPLIPEGEADLMIAFESLEALRWLSFLKKDGLLVVNRQEIKPTTVTSGRMHYPENIYGLLVSRHRRTQVLDGLALARAAGNARSINSVLLGAVSSFLPVPERIWKKGIREIFPAKVVEANLRAFDLGRNTTARTR